MNEKPKVLYTAYFLTNPKLFSKQIPPVYFGEGDRHYDDVFHVTKDYKPLSGLSDIKIGRKRTFYAIGQAVMDDIQAVLVQPSDSEKISKNEYPHITIVTAKGERPQDSNKILKKAIEAGLLQRFDNPIPFEVVEGYHDGEKIHISTD